MFPWFLIEQWKTTWLVGLCRGLSYSYPFCFGDYCSHPFNKISPPNGLQGKTWCTWSYFQRIARRLRSCRTRRGAQNRGGYMGVFSKSKLRCLIISTNSMCFQKVANFQTPPYQLEYLLAMWASAMQRLSRKGRLKEENQDVGREPPSRFRTWMTNETLQVNRSQWFAWIDDFSRKLDIWRTFVRQLSDFGEAWNWAIRWDVLRNTSWDIESGWNTCMTFAWLPFSTWRGKTRRVFRRGM